MDGRRDLIENTLWFSLFPVVIMTLAGLVRMAGVALGFEQMASQSSIGYQILGSYILYSLGIMIAVSFMQIAYPTQPYSKIYILLSYIFGILGMSMTYVVGNTGLAYKTILLFSCISATIIICGAMASAALFILVKSLIKGKPNIVLFGYPTAGKGTQATLLAKRYDIPHISTGEIFRQNMADKTPLGLEIDELMRAGNLVSDEKTIEIVFDKLDSLGKGWILDGFPRSKAQAEAMEEYIKENKRKVYFICLDIDREEAFRRSKTRAEKGRFEDADDDVINKRLDVFEETTQEVIDHFSLKMKYVLGWVSIENIFGRLSRYIDGR